MARSPSRLCSRDGRREDLLLLRHLEYDFHACFCALLPTSRFSFLYFLIFFLHPVMFIFVSLRLCSSRQLLTASTYFIVRVLSARVICTLPHLGIISFFIRLVFFFVVLISRVAFFCCALVPGTLST